MKGSISNGSIKQPTPPPPRYHHIYKSTPLPALPKMGFLGFTQSTTSSTPPTAPNRSQRALCWTARDQFFACLDKHNILDPLKNPKESKSFCGPEDASFQKECKGSWVHPPSPAPPRSQTYKDTKILIGEEEEGEEGGIGRVLQEAPSNGTQPRSNAKKATGRRCLEHGEGSGGRRYGSQLVK